MKLVGHTLYAPCLPERVRAATGITKIFGPWKLTPEQKNALRKFLGLAVELPPDIPVPDAFGAHQKKGLAFLLSRNGRAMLAMEMGTGKTWTVIECLKHYGVLDRTLVLAPKSVVSSWVRELRLRAPHVEPRVALESAKVEALSGTGPWLTNYETVRNEELLKQMAKLRPGAIVLDESTKIKDRTTITAKKLHGLTSLCKGPVIAMSGLPAPENPLDTWSQVKAFQVPPLGYSTWFAMRQAYAIMGGYGGYEITGWKNLPDFYGRFAEVAFRVRKDECLDLPPKIYQVRDVELPRVERKAYEDMKKDCLVELRGKELSAANVLAQVIRLQQITSGWAAPKAPAKLVALAEVLEDAPRPWVVWCRFSEDIERVLAWGKKQKLRLGRLDGSVPAAERGAMLDAFAEGKVDLLAANAAAGGMGVQLQRASVQVYYSCSWSHEQRAQSEDRLHRLGQEKPVTIVDLVCADTIDETVRKALVSKQELSKLVMGDVAGAFSGGKPP